MYHYMAALHQRFFQVPDFTELEEEIEQTRQEVRDCLGQPERRKLMQLVDAQILLREKISSPVRHIFCQTVYRAVVGPDIQIQ